ncbi:hypothetical protein EXIGLDRAFT_842475 [Exidia glandulosa HHB12029]|uniref:C2H2-type domain-containing protein n=1 Tax=Exidia glandulosa HHB12029 TaxID=1314781 RepID=A0A165DA23_EXIGL|nr:hypothetical protein EXIGLDRAFT_842475 [Exidia glandulosa HHB12029]
MRLSIVFAAVLSLAAGVFASPADLALRVDEDFVVRDKLMVRDAAGVEHTLYKKSPAEASVLFGRACTICDDRGCGCCGVPPGVRGLKLFHRTPCSLHIRCYLDVESNVLPPSRALVSRDVNTRTTSLPASLPSPARGQWANGSGRFVFLVFNHHIALPSSFPRRKCLLYAPLMQYSDEEHNHLGEYTPAYLSRFTLAPGMQRPNYSQNVAPVLAPAPDPLSTLASIPRGHGYHQHVVASLSNSNFTPHWTNASFSPASGDNTALFTPPLVHWELPNGPQHYARGAQQDLQYHDVPRFPPSPTFGFQFQPENMSSLPTTNPFGTVDRDGSFVPGRGPVQHRVNATANLDDRVGAPVTPRADVQDLRGELMLDSVSFGVGADATQGTKRKAEDDAEDTPAPDARAVEDAARKRGVPRKGKGAAAARASKGHGAKSSQRGSRKKGRIDSDETTVTSTDNLGPSVQADNNYKPGAKPRTPLGLALESFNATKIASLLKLAKKVKRAETVSDALALLTAYSETPTVEDMNGFKATLALVVATSGGETTTCDACVTDFEVAVPLAATTALGRHLSEYHRGLRTCPACSYLLVQRGTNGAERHRTWCPIWKALGTRGAQEEWLRQRGLLAIEAPSSQFFNEETITSAEKVAKGDRAVMERELLASLSRAKPPKPPRGTQAEGTTVAAASGNDDVGGDASAADVPVEGDKSTEGVRNLNNRVEGRSNAQYGSTGSYAPAEHWHLSGIDVLAGPEWDEDADGEYDLDDDCQIDSGSALSKGDSVHEESVLASASIDGGSTAGVWSGHEGENLRVDGMNSRGLDARADSGNGAQRPFRTGAREAEHARVNGDRPSWEDVDVIDRTYAVTRQSQRDSATIGTVGQNAFEAMLDGNPYSFDDTTATLQDLDDFYA